MKNLKVFTILLGVLLFSVSIAAQTTDAGEQLKEKAQFIIRGGGNASTVTGVIDGEYGAEKYKFGYHLGIMAHVHLGKNFYLQPGLQLTAKGSKLTDVNIPNAGTANLSMNAIFMQVPVLAVYKIDVNEKNKFNIAAGGYFAYGVGGKITGNKIQDADTFGDNGLCNRPDAGFTFEFQFELPKVLFYYGADFGVTKMFKREALLTDAHIRNYNLYLGVGYKF